MPHPSETFSSDTGAGNWETVRRRRDGSPARNEDTVTVTYNVSDIESSRSTRQESLPLSNDRNEMNRRQPTITYYRSQSHNSIPTLQRSINQSFSSPIVDDDIIIMVMGVTGSGKSAFINLLSDRNVQVGHSLTSCTTDPEIYTVPFSKDRRAYLIDTPGFDDTSRPDAEILKSIAFWLNSLSQQGKRLAGLIYMHRVTDVRMGGSASKNLELFRRICGPSTFPYVALVTTMWEMMKGEEGQRIAEEREETLRSGPIFWKDFEDGGSRVLRHRGTERSAREILQRLPRASHGILLDLQREMERGLSLEKTAAGLYLEEDLNKMKKKYEEELRQLQKELEEVRAEGDVEGEEVLQGERKTTLSKMHQNEVGVRALKVDAEDLMQEKGLQYRDDIQRQERMEISQDATLREQAEKLRLLEEEISYLKHLDKEKDRQIDALRRQDHARSQPRREHRNGARTSSSDSSSSHHLAQLEAKRDKDAAKIDKILLKNGSPAAFLKSIFDPVARYVYENLPNRPLQRTLTDPATRKRDYQ